MVNPHPSRGPGCRASAQWGPGTALQHPDLGSPPAFEAGLGAAPAASLQGSDSLGSPPALECEHGPTPPRSVHCGSRRRTHVQQQDNLRSMASQRWKSRSESESISSIPSRRRVNGSRDGFQLLGCQPSLATVPSIHPTRTIHQTQVVASSKPNILSEPTERTVADRRGQQRSILVSCAGVRLKLLRLPPTTQAMVQSVAEPSRHGPHRQTHVRRLPTTPASRAHPRRQHILGAGRGAGRGSRRDCRPCPAAASLPSALAMHL